MSQRWTAPYVRLATADGADRTLYFWNGVRTFVDPYVKRGKNTNPAWPCVRTFVIRDLPDDFTLAAGYEYALTTPNRFAANGPYEQIRSKDGSFLYEGEAVRKGFVAFEARSSETKRIVRELPKDLPDYERALKHAKEQHYFRASEPVSFVLAAIWRKADYAPDEVVLRPRLETVFGKAVDIAVEPGEAREEEIGAGLLRRTVERHLSRNPGIGVWHLETELDAGAGSSRTERTVFEVLPEGDGGPCPPLVSGLPTFLSMPNETKYLEESSFDPWSDLGGVAHYYAIDQRYPKVGMRLNVWKADHFCSRKWFTTVWDRNTDDLDPDSAANRELIRQVDYLGLYPRGKHREGRFDLSFPHFYIREQLQILKGFLAERGWPLKKLTAERIATCEREQKGISPEEFKELFDYGWNNFKLHAREDRRLHAGVRRQTAVSQPEAGAGGDRRGGGEGGGRVSVPKGMHRVGGLLMRSNVELHLEDGAELNAVTELENYPLVERPFSEGIWSAIVMGPGT